MWTVLITTLPSQPNAVRLRIWRALKALGCAALRDGAYFLPESHADALQALADEVQAHGGSAQVLALAARNAAQQQALLALFDRGPAYAQWRDTALALQQALPALDEVHARRRHAAVAEALLALQRIDYLPGAASTQAQEVLDALRLAMERRCSPGEPQARALHAVKALDHDKYQGRRWATRQRPRVDRLACAWLIKRFIDRQAQFVWLPDVSTAVATPRGAVGFDYDGARFSHVGALVTFEVLLASFALQNDTRLTHLGAVVRCLDTGGIPMPEAAGLQAVLDGLRAVHADDDKLVRAAATVFDALYALPAQDAS